MWRIISIVYGGSRRIIGVVLVVVFISIVLILGLIALCLRICKAKPRGPDIEVDIPVPASPPMRVDKQDLEPIDPGIPETALFPGSGPQVDISRVENRQGSLFFRETTFREHDRYVQSGDFSERIVNARAQRVGEHDMRTGAVRMSPTKMGASYAAATANQSSTVMREVAVPVHSSRTDFMMTGGSPSPPQRGDPATLLGPVSPSRQMPSPLRGGDRDDSRPQWWM